MPLPDAGLRCCDDGVQRTIRVQCHAGEVGLPVSRCDGTEPDAGGSNPDAGPGADASPGGDAGPAGDTGVADAGPRPDGGGTCGNLLVEAGEDCETNDHCGGAPAVCRSCVCAMLTDPLELSDPPGDTAGGAPAQTDLVTVRFWLNHFCDGSDNPDLDCLLMTMGGTPMGLPQPYRICLVIESIGAEVGRLCYARLDATTIDVLYTDPFGPERSVIGTVFAGDTFHTMEVPHSLGLRLSAGNEYYWTTYYGAAQADRLPDTGLLRVDDLVGRQ